MKGCTRTSTRSYLRYLSVQSCNYCHPLTVNQHAAFDVVTSPSPRELLNASVLLTRGGVSVTSAWPAAIMHHEHGQSPPQVPRPRGGSQSLRKFVNFRMIEVRYTLALCYRRYGWCFTTRTQDFVSVFHDSGAT